MMTITRGKAASLVLGLIILASLAAPLLTPYDPDEINLDSLKSSPSHTHPLGTDQKGRDVLARVLHGGRISVGVAITAAVLSMSIGLLVGLVSGYFGGRLDTALMALVDLVLSFPSLLLAIGISMILPQGIYTVMIAIAAVGWAAFARLIRGHVLALREEPYVEAAKALGCGPGRIIFVHLLPQCVPLSLVMTGLKIGGFIITEASLSFLGLGAQPPTASWGSMISAGRSYIVAAPWMVLFPGLAIAVTALSFNILGDALQERFGLKKIKA
ncbi:MAG: ABC transporter permease [Nitrospirota bacterium]|jgi:ABC-type dipeptide/oligopeptide/nickel transport system permease subunit